MCCKKCPTITLPSRTAVPFWGQIALNLSGLSPKRDCGPKARIPFHMSNRPSQMDHLQIDHPHKHHLQVDTDRSSTDGSSTDIPSTGRSSADHPHPQPADMTCCAGSVQIQIQPRKPVLLIYRADSTAPTRQRELDHTDRTDRTYHTDHECIFPERARSSSGSRRSARGIIKKQYFPNKKADI